MGSTSPQLKPHQQQQHRLISSATPRRRRRRLGFTPHHHRFPIGSLVEVQTDEEDFKSVYFLATVISPPPPSISKNQSRIKNKNKQLLYVEYHNLLASEGGSERLTEIVDVSFVRPAPPPQELVRGFEANDAVDAFYKDGWWTGVVNRVVERGERFIVTFQYPPDELEFGLSELRVHWEWVDGSWIRAQNKSLAAVMYDVGRKVEVSLDAEDCRDAWFPAIINEKLGNGAFVAEYSRADGDKKAQRLKIMVDSNHVRPSPPHLKEKHFVLLEKVDAYFDFGWWSGVITKELEGNRYIVFFRQTKRDKEFHQSELRPYVEWKDGKWFISSKLSQDSLTLPSEDVMNENKTPENAISNFVDVPVNNVDKRKDDTDVNTPSSVNLMRDLSEQLTPHTHELSQEITSTPGRRRRLSISRDALLQPQKKQKGKIMHRASEQNTLDRSSKENLPGSLTPGPVNNMKGSATQTGAEDQSDNTSWGKRIQRKQRKVGSARYSEKLNLASSTMKKSSEPILEGKGPEADAGGKEPNAVGNIAEDVEDVQNKLMNIESKLSVVIGLPCAGMESPEFGIYSRGRKGRSSGKETMKLVIDLKQQLDDSSIQDLKDSKQSETGELSGKRKRGRPRKLPLENLPTPVKGNAQNGVPATDNLSRIERDPQRTPEVGVMGPEASLPTKERTRFDESQVKQAYSRSGRKIQRGSTAKRTLSNLHEGEVIKESVQQTRSTGRGKRRNTDSLDTSGRKSMDANCIREVAEVETEAPCTEFDNEPLSKWIEGRHPPSLFDGSKTLSVNNLEECAENNQRQEKGLHVLQNGNEKFPETGEQTYGSVDIVSVALVEPSNQQKLPFVKSNILWKMIDSMEAFQRIPQRPHFQPLEHCKESSREGLAIGYMVTFSGVVEKVSALQFNCDKSVTDDILETLADLERHGFEVGAVRERVTRLVSVKEKQGKLVDNVNEINSQILMHNREKSRIEEDINDMNQQIQKLQEKLLLAESRKKKEDGEVATLQAKLLETEESIKNVENEFEGIAATMWK